MNNCGTCKYFGSKCGWDEDVDDVLESNFHVCTLIKHNEHFKSKFEGMACVIDGSGYTATLCVKEDFGCNQWTQADGPVGE